MSIEVAQDSEPIEALKSEVAAAQQRLDALLAAQRQPAAPEQAMAPAEPPPVSAEEPGMHYPGDHIPNQHEPGPRAPIPVSHVPYEFGEDLDHVILEAKKLKYTARFWRIDAAWPPIKQLLEWHEITLTEYLWRAPDSREHLAYLKEVRRLLGPRIMARFVRFLKGTA